VRPAVLVPELVEEEFHRADPVILWVATVGPAPQRLPPMFGVTHGPSEAVVVGCGRARDLVVAFRQVRERVGRDHCCKKPCCFPHSIHAWAMSGIVPDASGGTGFSPV